jgi:hypothetical protein
MNGNPDYTSIAFVLVISGIFAMIIYTVGQLSGSSALTAMVAFTIPFSAGMWMLVIMRDLLQRIEQLDCREKAVAYQKRYLAHATSRVHGIIASRLSIAEQLAHQMRCLVTECKMLCDSCLEKEQVNIYGQMETKRFYQWIEASLGMKYKVAGDESACITVLGEIIRCLVCPIAFEVPVDPVISSTGIMYSREHLNKHFQYSKSQICPLTNRNILWQVKALVISEICKKLRHFADS